MYILQFGKKNFDFISFGRSTYTNIMDVFDKWNDKFIQYENIKKNISLYFRTLTRLLSGLYLITLLSKKFISQKKSRNTNMKKLYQICKRRSPLGEKCHLSIYNRKYQKCASKSLRRAIKTFLTEQNLQGVRAMVLSKHWYDESSLCILMPRDILFFLYELYSVRFIS